MTPRPLGRTWRRPGCVGQADPSGKAHPRPTGFSLDGWRWTARKLSSDVLNDGVVTPWWGQLLGEAHFEKVVKPTSGTARGVTPTQAKSLLYQLTKIFSE
jgi:hypothetical protein